MLTGTPSSTRREKNSRSSSGSSLLRIMFTQVTPPQLTTEQLFGYEYCTPMMNSSLETYFSISAGSFTGPRLDMLRQPFFSPTLA